MIHRFGAFELDDQLFELRKGADVVAIQPKAFDILRCLVQSGGVVVSRPDLMAKVWPGVVVTNDSLAQAIMAARTALGDDGEEPTFIHTVRGRGYRFVAPVESLPRAKTKESIRPKTDRPPSTFVGRAQSLATLRKLLERARNARGGLCLVTGESGVGKTRLVEELCAEATGVLTISVRCYDGEGAPELWPFAQALRILRAAGATPPLDGELAALADGCAVATTLADPQARFRLFDGIVRMLTVRTDPRPLLFAIDDLHLADLDSLRLIALLSPQLRATSVLLVAAYGPTTPRLASFRAAMGALAQEASTSTLRLEPLTRDDVATFVKQGNRSKPGSGRELPDALLEKVFDKTRGNPLLLTQLVSVLNAEESLEKADVETSALVGGEGIRDAITSMLAALPESANRVLTVAAVFGVTFPLAPLAAALDETNDVVLRELDAADVVRVVARAGAARYRFTYPLVRDVLYKRLLPSERARLHGRVAAALGEHLGDGAEHARVAEIADHLVEAAAAGDVEGAVDCSLRAATLAKAAGDDAAAAKYAQRGLEAFRFAQRPDEARRALLGAFVSQRPRRE
ncbi:MAG: transcriptional regulator [Labilithrix sp.]|nr:transcriptional regulator [Labilithrix sp.]